MEKKILLNVPIERGETKLKESSMAIFSDNSYFDEAKKKNCCLKKLSQTFHRKRLNKSLSLKTVT